MRYFNYLTQAEEERIFHSSPAPFSNCSNREVLSHAIGAALYMPATRINIADDLISGKHLGLVSVVMDLEDAVGDYQVEFAEDNLSQQIQRLAGLIRAEGIGADDLPLIFIRIRTPNQMEKIIHLLEPFLDLVTGFAIPKFNVEAGSEYFDIICSYNERKPSHFPTLYAMPILETAEVIFSESRFLTLYRIKELLSKYRELILNVRIGATDFSSLFGLRRGPDMTVYDIGVIRDCITDIVNIFGRADEQYVISGPVWEYFENGLGLKPHLQVAAFEAAASKETDGVPVKHAHMDDMFNKYMQGLFREVLLDKANGMIGKTVIHPTHILPVQSLYVVTYEEYIDAINIVKGSGEMVGVVKSQYANKMNEIKPHLNWANRILKRAKVYGVLNENENYTSILLGHESSQRETSVLSYS
ncbi:HpcH/HpaI aldolase/citrate lyase family protein [Paenibacillus sp.]|jgi:citrate lyase beta subunit|uniref:HpcH/HpaI aldolase/citrate lyase family protein n=1 Tax=Paenibacillus sp. TaxID=58172 RepID=UPI00282205F8|nr:HpcH/HpaI aldolase/citrate lyase family protein [Paenibacillus sp.]MDR0269897.1 HpcH/HpaI aldolase/citrate lyase family protein [Paenibacillus sp.]